MVKKMYNELINVVRNIVKIANEREKIEDGKLYSVNEIDDFFDPCDDKINDILMGLDLEQIMAIQTIMYLGRDKDYNPKLTSDEIFNDYKKYIESKGIKTKTIEARQIVEKGPLAEYLIEGYRILGINL